ncbi:MBL fold metallo-hydrolase [Roseibium sp. Sym1]|uniref:MBL fold metallo-hydrolase n=1 Tax=Roseibium sp. Sym1 TaxID=3016006 RepID=UPI0022B36848|nr:MBL fold metallo-hydrolase [Roseibium sp. Sym1]
MVVMTNGSEAAPGANEQFESLGRGCYAFSADGCSNTGVVIGERGVLVIDGQATPAMAERALARIRELTDKPVKSLVLTHFHADNTLGAAACEAGEVIASDLTRRMMETRGAEDIRVSRERDPRLFSDLPADAETSMPSMTIASSMTIDLGGLDVRLMHLGRAHTMGDLVVWVPEAGVIYAGDLVQKSAIPYCGDAHLADWPRALDRITAFRPTTLVPGRGRIAEGAQAVATAVETTRDYVTTLRDAAAACVEQSLGLKDTYLAVKDALSSRFAAKDDFEFHLPLNVARAYDEALGLDQPQVWTRERLADLRDALEGAASAAETVSEETIEAPAETVEAVEDTPAEATAEAPGAEAPDLVSDSDFAASLALEPEEGQGEDEVSLDLSEEDIVEDDESSEPSPESAEEDRKVLEDAR